MSTTLDSDKCPHCGYELNACSNPDDLESKEMPKKGDISICINCAKILTFDKDLKLQPCPKEIIDELDEESLKQIVTVRSMILGMNLE